MRRLPSPPPRRQAHERRQGTNAQSSVYEVDHVPFQRSVRRTAMSVDAWRWQRPADLCRL